MDRKKQLGLTTVVLSAMVLAAGAAHDATAVAGLEMFAKILPSPLAALSIVPLDFGTVTATGTGTLKINAKDTHTAGANVTEIAAGHAGQFKVAALDGVPFLIDYPDTGAGNAVVLDETGPGTDTMRISSIVVGRITAAGVASDFMTVLSGTTPFAHGLFGVGGTLNVNANQTPGTYTGSVSINVTYP